MRIEIIAHRFDHFVTHANDGVLAFAAQPEMAVVHQEIRAMFLGRDGIGIRFRNAVEHLGALHIHFIAAGRALLGANFAAKNQRRFLSEIFQRFKQRFVEIGFHRNALHDAGAVAHEREHDFAGFAEVVEPAGDFHRIACVASGVFDSDAGVGHG